MRPGLLTLLVGAFFLVPRATCVEHCGPGVLQASLQDGVQQDAFIVYDADGLFTPLGDLSALSTSHFTRLSHPAFPRHSVRAKQSQFCDGKVRAYTGYIDVEAHHLFWFFFESRGDPDADDVIFWTNGGPGGSGAVGLFSELGPCRVTSANSTEWNPWSWNEHANIFFIEQPVSVGFSYAEFGEAVSTTREAADDVAALMGIFFEHFTKFKGRALHLAGESYGGRYIPVFASAIYDKNTELVEAGLTPINLTSIMLGNGCTDFATMFPSYYDAQCADPTFPAIQDISTCVRLKQMAPRCEQRFKKSCVDTLDKIDCAAAAAFCFQVLTGHYKNPYFYDRSRPCTHDEEMEVCYPIISDINAYLSQPYIQELLGVDAAARGNYSLTSATVAAAFDATLDWYSFPAQYHIAALLERGVRALVFVGATDFICNWIGNERMTLGLEWTQQEAYRSEPLTEWLVDGKPAGLTRSGGGLTFATISGAGHLAPYDRPVEASALVNRWLAGEAL